MRTDLLPRKCVGCGETRFIRKSRIGKYPLCHNCKFTKHGMSRSGTYYSFHAMQLRCLYDKGGSYERYGAKGITICDRWVGVEGFDNFVNDMGERPRGTTLDRIDSTGNYEPSNCKWSTSIEQANNKSNTLWLTYNGRTYKATEWAYLCGCPYKRFVTRLKRGWTMEKALFTPLKKGDFSGNARLQTQGL